ncbi:MAG: type I-C CRISPR-associated protein Cas8c/Csd1 [Alphaproteobacteria bacterium]|nr:type I-C CRISPR-associated protein Cas8c/Csd1 [Alphaproteobacteria bacterium]
MVLDSAGNIVRIASKTVPDGKRQIDASLAVPVPPADRRGKKIVPAFLWDPTPYSLGVSLDQSGAVSLTADNAVSKFNAFRDFHLEKLANTDDPGLVALRNFLEQWDPALFVDCAYPVDIVKSKIVFRLNNDTNALGEWRYIHERQSTIDMISGESSEAELGLCLVTGKQLPVARLHPSFGGFGKDAQSSGAYLVSFNIGSKTIVGASSSYGKEQGDNAPVSETAAFAYGTALKSLLAKGSGHNLRVGDATVVFWVETPDRIQAETIEQMLFGALQPEDDAAASNKLRAALEAVAKGRAAQSPEFDSETRVYILGLAPNAARLSVRFWHPGTFGDFARHITRFWDDLALEPSPFKTIPAAWSLLYETALQHKAENIPPRLGGDLMRAVLTGAPYPRTLLSGVISRIRADGDINGRRAAICRAFINRNIKREEIPMSLDRDNPNPAYRLGRLFAVLERTQQAALPGLNATIRDRYFAAASATPARIFPQLTKNTTYHLSLMRKGESGGLAYVLDREMGEIWTKLDADLPRSLNLEDQGRFVAGYYHQRWTKKDKTSQDEKIETGSIER